MIEKKNLIQIEIIGIHLIISLFMETLLDIIKNTSSSLIILLFSDEKLQTYFYSTIQTIQNAKYLISQKKNFKSIVVINIYLNINKYKKI